MFAYDLLLHFLSQMCFIMHCLCILVSNTYSNWSQIIIIIVVAVVVHFSFWICLQTTKHSLWDETGPNPSLIKFCIYKVPLKKSPGSVLWSTVLYVRRRWAASSGQTQHCLFSQWAGMKRDSPLCNRKLGSSPPKLLGNNPVRPAPYEHRRYNPNYGKSDNGPSFNDHSYRCLTA